MDRLHWTLVATAFAKGRGLSPVQLQKALFLLGKGMPQSVGEGFYQFIPHNYGPFSKEIYLDAERLASEGLVAIVQSGSYPEYICTAAGQGVAKMISGTADARVLEYFEQVVHWVQSLSFSALVRAIYSKYPEYRENSVFQD